MPTRWFNVSIERIELLASALVKLKVLTLFDCGVKASEGEEPFMPMVVVPVEPTDIVISLLGLYWTRNCGCEIEVMV